MVLTLCTMLLCLLLPATSFADPDFALIEVKACDANGNGLSGATFTMHFKNETGEMQTTTNKDGKTYYHIPAGHYRLEQTTPPDM